MSDLPQKINVLIVGAGAAGMMCAIEAAKRGRSVVVIDHNDQPGEKIRISGGGRCNFTNIHTRPENFVSANAHFCKSALSRFTPRDFIKLIETYGIAYHEKTLGQLFCDNSAMQIIDMLLSEMDAAGARLMLETSVSRVENQNGLFHVKTSRGVFECDSLVIATGGLSIPKMGATPFGYDIARQFGHSIVETRAALVPLLFAPDTLALTKELAGVSVDPITVQCGKTSFREALLFTHRGLSGPAILQISSYWDGRAPIIVNLLPDMDVFLVLKEMRSTHPRTLLHNALATKLPKRLAEIVARETGHDMPLADLSDAKLRTVADHTHRWHVTPIGTEGYRTAEVTAGGVDTSELSSKTMESQKQKGLYFIGEVVDVTGHLGGFNFQWAWASGWCTGQFV